MGEGPETAGRESCAGWWVRELGTVLPCTVTLPANTRSVAWTGFFFHTRYSETTAFKKALGVRKCSCSKSIGVGA